MKIKRTTYGEFKKRFSGLKRLMVDYSEHNLETKGFIPILYRVIIMYRKSMDCTYIAISCIGYIDLFGPRDDALTYVIKIDGKVTAEDLIDKEFKYHEELTSITEELYNKWHDKLQKNKETEEES